MAAGIQEADRSDGEKAGMMRPLAVAVARTVRGVRGLCPDRNPLRRTVDRAEAVLLGLLAVAFLAGAPLAAVAAGHAAYAIGSRTAQAQQASWRQVPAVLLAAAPAAAFHQLQVTVPASWVAPDGTRHAGTVLASPGTSAGQTVTVWVDKAGRLTGNPPLELAQVRAQVVLATMLTPVAVGFVLLCMGLAAHAVLGRRRMASWETDWQVTEPQWTGRR